MYDFVKLITNEPVGRIKAQTSDPLNKSVFKIMKTWCARCTILLVQSQT